MAGNPIFAEARRRNLAILAAIALASVVLAFLGLRQQAANVAPKYTPSEFFPGFAQHIREAARIHIASKKNGTFDVVFKPSKGWVLPGKDDYPASFEEVNRTLVGLAALETMEPKTARPDWFHYIDLGDPAHGGDGVAVTVSDDHGRVLASLIVGKSEDIGDAGGAVGLFVRKPDDNQSWLVRSAFEPRSDPSDWVEKNVISVDQGRIKETVVNLPGGQSFTVGREKAGDKFKLMPMPAGREMASDTAADGLATAVSDFSFDDVRPGRDMDFSAATRLVTRTFDGLAVTLDVLHSGEAYWAQLGAMAMVNDPKIGKEARAINAHVSGWAFKLPDYKGSELASPLDSLLKPKAAK